NWTVGGEPPFGNMYHVLIFLGLCFLPLYYLLRRRQGLGWLHLYFAFAGGVALVGAIAMGHDLLWRRMPALQSPWFMPHVVSYMVSYALATVAFVLTLVAVVKHRLLSQHSPEELARRISMSAVPVDEIVRTGGGLEGLRVARVTSARPHPDADRLTLCRVDDGTEERSVVCGAPDVVEGALYPYVAPGGRLPGGTEIESREIRGQASHGMLCSARELELGRDAAGILRLPDDLRPGQPLAEVLGLPDTSLVLDLTPNRVDLACHVGVARELAPAASPSLHLRDVGPDWSPTWRDGNSDATGAGVRVTVEAPDRCPRYLGAVIRDVEVRPSPAWLAGRLRAVGARPVNNVVDATNYVLLEMNQPLHAFDLEKIGGSEIRIRAAREGETITTLDGEDRSLSPEATVIADDERPVALAGVMGGEESEVTAETRDVFLECALFDPAATRRTARCVELATDASYRFERGVDPRGPEAALRRCVELVLGVAGGKAGTDAVRVGVPAPELRSVTLRPARLEQVLGREFGADELRALLEPIGFDLGEGAPPLSVRVPGWRGDVTREIDLVEEVARRHGYEAFPSERRAFRPSAVLEDPAWPRAERVRRLLEARGFLEARGVPLVSAEAADPDRPVRLLHPLSAEEGHLRGSLVAPLLKSVEHNFARSRRDVRLYEIGTVFRRATEAEEAEAERAGVTEIAPGIDVVGGVRQELRAAAVMTGRRRPEHWSEEVGDVDVWELKGLAEEAAKLLPDVRVRPADPAEAAGAGTGSEGDVAVSGTESWAGVERFVLEGEEGPAGIAARVRPDAVDGPPWAGSVWALEWRLGLVEPRPERSYTEHSTFPAVHRDLAFTVPRDAAAASVEETIRGAAPAELERVRLFDVYEGEGVEEGRRSLAFRFRFRAADRTLKDEEADRAIENIVTAVEERWDARIRTA
ncbi:MAG: phenylalanine--tRNA ligase subunit beta, partial [Gemmatimonadota bacterium]